MSSSAVTAESPPLKPPATASYKDMQSFGSALSLMTQVDRNNRDAQIFLYFALAGMIEKFDRYSYFVSPDIMPLFLDSFNDEYIGIGIHPARTADKNIEVVSVDKGSPAETAGLVPKDVITALDGIPIKSMDSTDIVRLIRSPAKSIGTEIRVTSRKPGSLEEKERLLKLERIKTETIESCPLHNAVGYIRIQQFKRNTPEDLKKALSTLKNKTQMKNGLILDLRNNPGGEILSSVDVARLFINDGIIASTESNYPDLNVTYKTSGPSLVEDPLVVLINEGSASGAELVAGAIKFYGRGTLIGQKTFGKGTFQSFVPITNEMGAYLTLGRFKLPDGISPEGVGIIPDITIEEAFDNDGAIEEAMRVLTKPTGRE